MYLARLLVDCVIFLDVSVMESIERMPDTSFWLLPRSFPFFSLLFVTLSWTCVSISFPTNTFALVKYHVLYRELHSRCHSCDRVNVFKDCPIFFLFVFWYWDQGNVIFSYRSRASLYILYLPSIFIERHRAQSFQISRYPRPTTTTRYLKKKINRKKPSAHNLHTTQTKRSKSKENKPDNRITRSICINQNLCRVCLNRHQLASLFLPGSRERQGPVYRSHRAYSAAHIWPFSV